MNLKNLENLLIEINNKLYSKFHIKILYIFNIIILILLSIGVFYFHSKYIETSYSLKEVNEYIKNIDKTYENEKEKEDFISKSNVFMISKGVKLDTNIRYVYLNYCWSAGKKFEVDPYRIVSIGFYESSLNPNSGVVGGGLGMQGITKSTFRVASKMLNEDFNDIYDLYAQTTVCAFWLRMLYDDCKSWELATTRYNAGLVNENNLYSSKVEKLSKKIKE